MITDISLVPVESWDAADIKPYPYNNKKHPQKHVDLLKRSIAAQGLLDPIVVDKAGVIISGHGRFAAVSALGWAKVPVRVLRDITDDQASALRIAANKTVSNEYDTDMLSRELKLLSETDMDLGALGFDEKELSMLIADVGEIDEDSLVVDMDAAIDAHEDGIEETAKEADEHDVRLDKAFGFKTIPLRSQKTVTRFMAEVESRQGKQGVEALLDFMNDAMRDGGMLA